MLTQYIQIFSIGAVCLAALYHTILFIHRRESILRHYCIYLWVLFTYLFYRLMLGKGAEKIYWDRAGIILAIDAVFLMATYLAYIKFWGKALLLSRKDGLLVWGYYQSSFPIIISYIIWEMIAVNVKLEPLNSILYVAVRVHLSFVGLLALYYVLKRRSGIYFYYLSGGTLAIVLSGVFSVYIQLFLHKFLLGINPFGWMMFGYFLDVVFFSAAIGYRLKTEAAERIAALKKVLEQQQIIQGNDLDKLKTAYLAREQERSRIIADLHDDVGATLSSMHLYSDLAQNVWQTQPQKGREMVGNISGLAKDLMARMSDIVWSMKPAGDENFSLEARIINYCIELLQPCNIMFITDIDKALDSRINQPEARKNILLIAKEALNNIAKYSGAGNVTIRLAHQGNDIQLTIADNGCGYDIGTIKPGNGLQNILHRCTLLGGNCSIEAKPGTGVTVQCRFPIAIFSNVSFTNGQ